MLTVSIQAGGRSSRMGRDKALLSLGGVPLIERVLEKVADLGDELQITSNDPDRYRYLGVPLIPDPEPGAGALLGLLTALRAATHDRVLVVGCDMPFLSRPLLERLVELAPKAEAVLPLDGGRYEPLLAVYSRACIPAIEASLAAGDHRMISFLPEITLHTVEHDTLDRLDPERLSFFNVNTPDDLQRAEELLVHYSA